MRANNAKSIFNKGIYIPYSENKASYNMALDEYLLSNKITALRFYSWKPKSLSIGYFQNLEKEINIQKAKELNIDIVRRLTGGGAVFHDKELTYSLIIPEEKVSLNIEKSYELICDCIIKALTSLGFNAKFRKINDITLNDKKISGNAQTRKNGFILQHGTILLGLDVDEMFSLLNVPDEKLKGKLITNVKESVTYLEKIDVNKLMQSIKQNIENEFSIIFKDEIIKTEIDCSKYENSEWLNWR